MRNADPQTVAGFGSEWSTFDQSPIPQAELDEAFRNYFALLAWDELPKEAVGADLGCGSGRWARLVAGRIGHLHCLDASGEALAVARRNLAGHENVTFHLASVGEPPIAPDSLDFAYSLGVLHHVPDPAAALGACVRLLRPHAPLLLYLYYALDNRPAWYRALWRLSDRIRRGVSRLPPGPKRLVSDFSALAVYWPLARAAAVVERFGGSVSSMPLAFYRHKSLYAMRTDAMDRFGTRLERRFRRDEIEGLMLAAGLEQIRFADGPPYWRALGRRADDGRS